MRLKWDAAQMRKLKQALRSVSGEGAKGFKKADKEASRLQKTLGRLKLAAIGFISSLGFGAALTAIGRVNGQLEQMRVAFNVMVGDAKKGGKVLQDIFAFTETTPFQFDDVAQAGRVLLAMGGDAATLRDELKLVGDVAAGTGQNIVEIASIFGKIRAKQRLTAEEMMQLAERGVPIYEELEKITGKSGEAMNKLVEQGKIRFPVLEQVFRNLTGEGGKFNNMMEMQSKTFLGMVSTMKDMGLAAFRESTGKLFELLKTDLEAIKTRIEEMRKNGDMEAFTSQVALGLKRFYEALKTSIGFLIKYRSEIVSIGRAYLIYRGALIGITIAQNVYNGILYASRLALIAYRHSTIAATIATNGFKAALAGTGVGAIAIGIGLLTEAIIRFRTNTELSTERMDDFRTALADARSEMAELNDEALRSKDIELRGRMTEATLGHAAALLRKKQLSEKQAELSRRIDAGTTAGNWGFTRNRDANAALVEFQRNLPEVEAVSEEVEKFFQEITDLAAAQQALGDELSLRSRVNSDSGGGNDKLDFSTAKKFKIANPVLTALEEAFGSRTGDFEAKMNELRIKLARGVISEDEFKVQARKVAEAFRDQFAFMLDAGEAGIIGDTNFAEILGRDLTEEELRALREAYLDAFGDVKGVLKDTEETTEDVKDKTKALITTLRSIKSAVNGVRQMASSFGILGDELNRVVDGALNTADAFASIIETRGLIASGDLTRSAATASLVSGYVGVATSVISMIGGSLGKSGKDQTEAIKENTRRIEKAIGELAEAARYGEDSRITGDDAYNIALAMVDAQNATREPSWDPSTWTVSGAGGISPAFESLFDLMDEIGIDTSGFRNRLNRLRSDVTTAPDQGFFEDAMSDLSNFWNELQGMLTPLIGNLGGYNSSTVSGLIGQGSFLRSFGGASEDDLFRSFIEGLGNIEGISGDMRGFLEDLADAADPSTSAGRSAIEAAIQAVARAVSRGEFQYGSLDVGEVDDILSFLTSLLTGSDAGAEDEFTRSVQIARSITEIQANELVAIQETALMYLRDIRDSLTQSPAPFAKTGGGGRVQRSGGFGDVYLTIESGSNVEETMARIEDKLREAERSGVYI